MSFPDKEIPYPSISLIPPFGNGKMKIGIVILVCFYFKHFFYKKHGANELVEEN